MSEDLLDLLDVNDEALGDDILADLNEDAHDEEFADALSEEVAGDEDEIDLSDEEIEQLSDILNAEEDREEGLDDYNSEAANDAVDRSLLQELDEEFVDEDESDDELTDEEVEALAGLDDEEPDEQHDANFASALQDHVVSDEVGEELSAHDPEVLASISQRIADGTPVLTDEKGFPVTREWSIDFGPVWGPAGGVTTIRVSPQVLFRGEKIIATDTGTTPGQGTRVLSVAVGQKIQRPGGTNGTLTSMFAATALANGVTFDTAQRWARVSMTVSFVQSCTFDASVFGTAVVDV